MNLFDRLKERVLNDEPETPFDAEPSDLDLVDADEYDASDDVGDEASR